MKANELQIDDWAACEGKNGKVKELREHKLSLKTENSVMIVYYNNVEPIPLTAEILEKNGFEKRDGEYQDVFYHYEGLDLLIDDRLEPCGYTLYGVFELQIKYVHELQHALRLAGIDKEITI